MQQKKKKKKKKPTNWTDWTYCSKNPQIAAKKNLNFKLTPPRTTFNHQIHQPLATVKTHIPPSTNPRESMKPLENQWIDETFRESVKLRLNSESAIPVVAQRIGDFIDQWWWNLWDGREEIGGGSWFMNRKRIEQKGRGMKKEDGRVEMEVVNLWLKEKMKEIF